MNDPIPSLSISSLKQTLPRALHLVWDISPGWTSINLVLVLIQGVLPLAALYLTKLIVDSVTAGLNEPSEIAFQPVLFWILIAAIVALIIALTHSLAELASEAQSMIVTDAVSDILHAQSIAVDLEYYEDTGYYDTLHRAQQEAPYRPTRIVNGLVQLGQNSISLLGVAGLLFAFNWIIGIVLFAAAIPAGLVRYFYARKLYRFEQEQTSAERQGWYYHWVLTDSDHAKEVRLLNLGPLFRERFRGFRKNLREGRLNLSSHRFLNDFLSQAIATVAIFGTFAFIAYQAVIGIISVGDLVMYYLAFQLGLGFLQSILKSIAGLYEDNLFLTNFYQFLDLKPKIRVPSSPVSLPEPIREGVVFHDVRFSYPSGTKSVLERVNLALHPGEVIALVGENGSGKSTLLKLFCRLYDPTGGSITVDGIDLREVDPILWRNKIAVLFQDYVHYYLSAKENIWVGSVVRDPESPDIRVAAQNAGADSIIQRLPKGYDTNLGHWFEEGQELSVGEWQKVALARSFFREAPIIVLDEPTSSMDPLAESELFRQFRSLLEGRSAILVSHRFSTVQMADRIYVLENGRIIEQGNHDELLRQGGKYARLFRAQAEHYQS